MATSSTTITKDNRLNAKPRGRSKRNIILEAIRSASLLNASKDATNEETEQLFFGHIAQRACNPEDQSSGMLLKLLTDKGWSSLKQTSELVNFDFDEGALPHIQATQVLKAASDGIIPPDIANTFISAIKSMIDIEEYTALKDRIEKLEAVLNGEP